MKNHLHAPKITDNYGQKPKLFTKVTTMSQSLLGDRHPSCVIRGPRWLHASVRPSTTCGRLNSSNAMQRRMRKNRNRIKIRYRQSRGLLDAICSDIATGVGARGGRMVTWQARGRRVSVFDWQLMEVG